jgi:hypothetical protein
VFLHFKKYAAKQDIGKTFRQQRESCFDEDEKS